MSTKYEIKKNEQFNSLEITFDGRPSVEVREILKAFRFRWHSIKKLWYGFADETELTERLNAIEDAAGPAEPAEIRESVGGVKVGDLFYTSWGYEQTNINFFQIVALKGKSSALVREVHPEIIETFPVSGMAEDRIYSTSTEILPPARHASFIKNNKDGDLRRIQISEYYKQPYIKVGIPGHYQDTAYPYKGEKLYCSWYA